MTSKRLARALVITSVVLAVLGTRTARTCPTRDCPLPSMPNFAHDCYDIYAVDGSDGCPNAGVIQLFAGPLHPLTVQFGPFVQLTAPMLITVRSYSSTTDYMLGFTNNQAGPCVFDVPSFDTSELVHPDIEPLFDGPVPRGVRFIWRLRGRDDMDAVLEARTHGLSLDDASATMTLSIVNQSSRPLEVGSRWSSESEISYPFGAWDAFLSWESPHPDLEPYSVLEQQMSPVPADFVVLTPSAAPSTHGRFAWNYVQIGWGGPCDPSGASTPPEIVQLGRAGADADEGAWWHVFDWDVPRRPRRVDGQGPILSFFWGRTSSTATTLAPGESVEWALNYVSWPADQPQPAALVPSWTRTVPIVAECTGDDTPVNLAVTLAGSSSTDVQWISRSPALTFEPSDSPSTVAHVQGVGRHEFEVRGHVGAFCSRYTGVIEVRDTTPPVLVVPPTMTLFTSQGTDCGVRARVEAAVTDACDGAAVSVVNDLTAGGATADATFPLGDTVVTFTATDASGNAASGSARVSVIDDAPPTVTVAGAVPGSLWPPNHRLVPVHVDLQVADDCDGAPSVRLAGVDSSQPDDGQGDGATTGDVLDASVGTADFDILLRAERSGTSARAYTLRYEAMDDAGNTVSVPVIVRVEHDQR